MKAVPKVNTDGLYMEDALVDDAFNGVVPFYAEPPVPDPGLPADREDETGEDEQQPEEQEPEIAGYIVGVPVSPGLYHPRFDLEAWEAYQGAEEPGEQSELWVEGLTPEEIEEITRPPEREPTETEILAEEVAGLKEMSAQNQSDIQAVGAGVEQAQTEGADLRQLSSALGSEQVKQELTVIDLRKQNNVLGGELVKKEISIMDLHMQNQVLGQMLAALELKLLAQGSGGDADV